MSRNTTQLYLYVGITLFLGIAVRTGLSIFCWECNSEYDRRCGAAFKEGPFEMTDCSQRELEHYPNATAHVCRKIVQKVSGQLRYIRACGFLTDERDECYRKAGTFDAQIEYCQCKDRPGCNSAPTTLLTSGNVVLRLALSVTSAFLIGMITAGH